MTCHREKPLHSLKCQGHIYSLEKSRTQGTFEVSVYFMNGYSLILVNTHV